MMKDKHFSKEQMEALAKYEKSFHTAVYSHYARGLSTKAYAEIRAIYEQITGEIYHLKDSCSVCVLEFLTIVGRKYFDTLLEATAPKEEKKQPKPRRTTKRK